MIRVTTNGTLHNYKSSLMNSTNKLNDAFETVLTGRKFNAYSEDPAAATQAFRLRSSLSSTMKQSYNNDAVVKKFSTAWDIIGDIHNDIVLEMGKVPALEGSNDPNLSVLPELGKVLISGAESIVQDMNATYGDNFIFGGAETLKVPFTWSEDGQLLYREQVVDNVGKTDPTNPNGYPTYEKLDDHLYVDIGLGFQEENGQLITSSAYDSALNGLDFLGYGMDEVDGIQVPNNVVSAMKRLGEIFQGYDLDTKTWTVGSREEAAALVKKIEDASSQMNEARTKLDADTTYLNTNLARLETTRFNLNEQVVGIEDVDQAEAIMDLVWAQQAYNAALQAGTSIIPQTLMDYLN